MAGRHVATRRHDRTWTRPGLLPVIAMVVAVGLVVLAVVTRQDAADGSGADPCANGRLDLNVVAAPELAPVLDGLARDYDATGPMTRGRCVRVDVAGKDPAAVGEALTAGWNEGRNGPRPDVWSPGSSSWLYRLRLDPRTATLLPARPPSLARSPLVVAMPRPMAEALGWPRRQLGWKEVAGLAATDRVWAAKGHPEWGGFKLLMPYPDRSTAGLNGLLGTYAALTADVRLRSPAFASEATLRGVLGLDRAVTAYAPSTEDLLRQMRRHDDAGTVPAFVSAFPLEEQAVWDYNHGVIGGRPVAAGGGWRPRTPLAAVYPTDGAPESDHPYVVLDADWVDGARHEAAAAFLDHLRGPDARRRLLAAGFRPADSNRGFVGAPADGVLPGQPSPALAPPSAEVTAKAVALWAKLRTPGNTLAVIDVSGSMADQVEGTGNSKLGLAVGAAVRAVDLFGRQSSVGLWAFSTGLDGDRDYRQVVPLGALADPVGGTSRRDALRAGLRSLRPGGATGLYDTTLAAFREVRGHWRPGHINTVVVLTDGRLEDGASVTLDDLLATLKAEQDPRRPVRIITIAYGADADAGALARIAAASGGAAHVSRDPKDIDRVFIQALAR